MSKRSEKEARNNNELISQLFPVLAVTALLSYFQYRKLKKQYLANPQAKRIDDLMAHTPILVVATLGILLVLSGVSKVADIDRMPFRPNHIFDSVVDIDIV